VRNSKSRKKQEKKRIQEAILLQIKEKIPIILKSMKKKVFEMLKRECDDNGLIEEKLFKEKFRSIVREIKEEYNFEQNAPLIESGVSREDLRDCKSGVLVWMGVEFEYEDRFYKIKNLQNNEEE
tara:strand:+ start:810 stop:1181 length:372 start_codon:yes stop_codon:yes gene_type:complete